VTRTGLSACIIAMDEEDRIGDCLASLDFCDEILVVDSHSRDRTREIAAARGARVIERDWPGFGPQRDFAVRAAGHDWVLCVDADERVSESLRDELIALRAGGFAGYAGWRIRRRSAYLGRWMRYGAWSSDTVLRLYDRRRARRAGAEPHDSVQLDGPAGRLRGELLHHPYRTLAEHLRIIDRYTTTMAEGMYAGGRRASPADLIWRPVGRFLKAYVLKLGFLEGWRGVLQASLAAYYAGLKYAKLLVLQHGREVAERPDKM
jgi:glycosyltransferase involved in cell wall biosynthesis